MNFTLRSWKLDDLGSLLENANNQAIARNLMDQFPHPYSEENGLRFIGMASSLEPQTILAIDVEGKAVGGIGLHLQNDIYRKNAEMGYWLGETYWGKGIMTQAIREMTKYGFANLDIERIFARPFATNLASQRVLEKAGFMFEAKLHKTIFKNGQFLDECIYSILRTGN